MQINLLSRFDLGNDLWEYWETDNGTINEGPIGDRCLGIVKLKIEETPQEYISSPAKVSTDLLT